ncbi:isoleucine--tRNA ligase, partial [Planctomycetaceae bacterium AH-315-I19]|nr:isoleucine--tRNA ligase [Planctomycetaceae bacterium AH-315-I19]
FPMKANLVQNEPASLKRWEKLDLYNAVQTERERTGKGRFVFHDGPPYANGSIHLGHLLNKCLKDFVVRSQLGLGKQCPFVPGWDCHGLPIEHKVMQQLAESGKLEKLAGLEDSTRRMAIRKECKAYASKFVKHQSRQMKRLLTVADYDNPYLTMTPAYEGATLEVFADLVAQGIVYRQLKAVHWSIANETALADAELEYQDREDISVYVDFECTDSDAAYDAFGLPEDDRPDLSPSFMIWTTTPWTLPANLGIAVHKDFTYALVRADGNLTILAEELVEKVMKTGGVENPEILATTTGEKLAGLRYKHAFIEGTPDFSLLPDEAVSHLESDADVYRVVLADYVTIEDGTGLVHTAPGHGTDDYFTGLREKLPIYCPVRADGTYDETTPENIRGLSIWDANEQITERLRESGHLFFDHRFMHSYPHDWRSKTPVIFRATEQWFIGVEKPIGGEGDSLREAALKTTANDVNFLPEWGRNRMRGMLESRPDWCISRQRSWGLPIPAFYDADGETILTTGTVRAIARAFRERGSDVWFTESAAQLLASYDAADDNGTDALAGVDLESLTKSTDIFDVWFESGSSWNSVMRERSPAHTQGDESRPDYPIDLYLEGSDQHRGWFQLSLLPALGVTGTAPFKSVLTHGFMVDKNGHKMSKSLGNAMDIDELMKDYGADVCRWWVGSTSYENDIKVNIDFFKTAGDAYRKVRNTLRFMLSNLSDFTPSPPGKDCSSGEGMCVALDSYPPTSIDAWVLGEYNAMIRGVIEAFNTFHFHRASTLLYNFCNDTLSAVYLAAVKDRLYCDKPDSERRRRTQSTMWDLTDGLCRALAVFIPHTADETYRALTRDENACVHLKTIIEEFPVGVDANWPRAIAARVAAHQVLEQGRASGDLDNPLDAGVTLPNTDGALGVFDTTDLADIIGVSRVELDASATDVVVNDLRDEPRCERSWKRDGTVKERSDGGMLSDRDAQAVGC